MATPPLNLAELQKAQAEAEGFQNGPAPALNAANLNTQTQIGNPQIPSTSPVPYYPSAETPNLQLSTDDMPAQLANNFVILDTAIFALVPVIVTSEQVINTQLPQSLSLVTPASATGNFYEVPIYLNSRGDGAAGSTATATLTWIGVSGATHTATLLVSGTVAAQAQLETFPILVLGGTTITVVTVFGTTPFHIDIAARILLLVQ